MICVLQLLLLLIQTESDNPPPTAGLVKRRDGSFTSMAKAISASLKLNGTNGSEESEKCPVCLKAVFRVEKVQCSGFNWHKSCFGESACIRFFFLMKSCREILYNLSMIIIIYHSNLKILSSFNCESIIISYSNLIFHLHSLLHLCQ